MIAYDEYGNRSAPVVLLLHGAAALDTFAQQYGPLREYHLIVPHLYGAGKSVDKTYEPEAMKREILCLLNELGCEKAAVVGHSLGAQLAVMLVSEHPERFSCAVFLSAWVNPKPNILKMYCALASCCAGMLRWRWLTAWQARYWHYNEEQTAVMTDYCSRITSEQYQAFFASTMKLDDYPSYAQVQLPMLAACGSREPKDLRTSLHLLAERNEHCRTLVFPKAGHDFPMRRAALLNPVLLEFLHENHR